MDFVTTIFRSYDIRGIANSEIPNDLAFAIGYVFGKKVVAASGQKIILGRDGRLSSPRIRAATIAGLKAVPKLTIIDIGICTTPMLSFSALQIADCGYGVMITASHNPKLYNGFKFVWNKGIYQDTPQLVQDIQQAGPELEHAIRQRPEFSRVVEKDITPDYLKFIKNAISISNKTSLIIDGSHGPAGAVAVQLFKELGFKVQSINCEVDGSFPNHSADTSTPENYRQLQEAMVAQKADMGILFDGDGDRFAAVDGKGTIVWPDQLLILMCEPLLREQQGSTIIFDVKCTEALPKAIRKLGGTPIMVKTGRAHIYKMMVKHRAKLAGEYSGHFFYTDNWIGTDDALYAVCRLIQSNQDVDKTFLQRVEALPHNCSTPQMLIAMDDTIKLQFIEGCLAKIADLNPVSIDTTDGIRITFNKGWALLRVSNTTPSVTIRFEAEDNASLQMIEQQFIAFCRGIAQKMSLPWQKLEH